MKLKFTALSAMLSIISFGSGMDTKIPAAGVLEKIAVRISRDEPALAMSRRARAPMMGMTSLFIAALLEDDSDVLKDLTKQKDTSTIQK